MNIFICRHTEVLNPDKIVYRRIPGFNLSSAGEAEAAEMGGFLKDQNISEIFTSPLERCFQVSEIIKRTIGNPKIKIYPKDYLNEWDDGETTEDIAERMNNILRDYQDSCVYISHKDPIRVFLNKISNRPLKDLEYWHCPHGAIYRIDVFNDGSYCAEPIFFPKKSGH